jgi:hypothetical protein
VVSSATTYMKGGASATLSDISVGTFVFAQGSYGTSATVVDATTVGIGQPGPGGPGAGPFGKAGPGGPPPGPAGPSMGVAPALRGRAD